jgi:hypothetical protein
MYQTRSFAIRGRKKMKEITLGAMLSNLKINKGTEILVYTESRAFKGKFVKMYPMNAGITLEVSMKVSDEENTYDLEISVDHIVAISLLKNDNFQVVPDSTINEDMKKRKTEE